MEIWRAIKSLEAVERFPSILFEEKIPYAICSKREPENSGNHDFCGLESNHGAVEVSAF